MSSFCLDFLLGAARIAHDMRFCFVCASLLVFFALAAAQPVEGQSYGEDQPDSSGTVREISEKFGPKELKELYDLLNSSQFQAPLTNYNCGEPVPKLNFAVRLRHKGYATTRAVEISHSPGLSPGGRSRCLLFGVDYLLDKAVASLDADPQMETTREPHCDCSKRDGKEEWVDFPGPEEVLAKAKVDAEIAARLADEALEEKVENLATIHLKETGAKVVTNGQSGHLVTHEKLLGTLPAESEMTLFAIDPTFSHWAYVIGRGGKQVVVHDGVDGKPYDEIPDHQRLAFSADGKHLAYIAKRGGNMFVVADCIEGKEYPDIEELFHPIFSPDGTHLAYIASRPAFRLRFPPVETFAVLDGKEQKGYDTVEAIMFSPDSRHFAYNAETKWNRGMMVVLDGKEGKSYNQISQKCFSPDSSRMAFVAYNRTNRSPGSLGMHFAVVGGVEGKQYKSVSSIQFSPDSKHVAYVATQGSSDMRVLMRDGAETKYGKTGGGVFSPDSQHLATVALFGTNWLVLIDGKKLEPQVGLPSGQMEFSPVGDLGFSPDSRHVAYTVRDTNCTMVLDGISIGTYERIDSSPVFTPDSQNLAYAFTRAGKVRVFLNGLEGKEYDKILGYDRRGEDAGGEISLTFDSSGVLHAMAVRDRQIFSLEMEVRRD
jgi:hypothetical protein